MGIWAGPVWAAAALLLLGGAAKARAPESTVRALRAAGLPASRLVVAGLAAAEGLIGAAVLVTGSRWALLAMAVSYVAFSAFVALALLRRWPLASCGCFGRPDTPPTRAHIAITGAAGAVAGAALLAPPSAPWTLVQGGVTLDEVLLAVLAIVLTWFAWAALALLPELVAHRSPRGAPAAPAAHAGSAAPSWKAAAS